MNHADMVAAVQQHENARREAQPHVDGPVQAAQSDDYERRSGRAAFWQKVSAAIKRSGDE